MDEQTGLLQWKVTVSDPSAEKDREKSISVTMLARVQPVPPETAIAGFNFRPVYFEGLGHRASGDGREVQVPGLVFRATGVRAPNGAAKSHSKPLSASPVADKSAA